MLQLVRPWGTWTGDGSDRTEFSNHPPTSHLFCLIPRLMEEDMEFTLPETNSSHLKMDKLKSTTVVSFLGWPFFRGYVSFRECK